MVLTKEELVASLQNEVRILVHLTGKVQPHMLEYRPTPKQRSTIELLRYLSHMGPLLLPAIQSGQFDGAAWQAATETRPPRISRKFLPRLPVFPIDTLSS